MPTTVTSLTDSGAGSLRQEIANTLAGGTVDFAAGLSGTITLTTGPININKDLTILGAGASLLTVQRSSAASSFGLLSISAGVNVSISGLTLTGGSNTTSDGGAIENLGTLTLANSVVTGNTVTSGTRQTYGGGIDNQGTLSINGCTFANNSATSTYSGSPYGYGGAIANRYSVGQTHSVTITRSTFRNNSALIGGAMDSYGISQVSNSTFVLNQASNNGGALENRVSANMRIDNSTFTQNSAQSKGAGIRNLGVLSVMNSTISGNSSLVDGGGISANNNYSGTEVLAATIVAGNTAPSGPDILASSVTANFCLIGNTSGATITGGNNKTGAALLGSLQDNGGPTFTMALLSGSPAIDAGSNASSFTSDQRLTGFNRAINGTTDIGAYEYQPPATTTTVTTSLNPSISGQSVTFTATVSFNATGSNTPQGTITFLDGSASLATTALVNSVASLSTAALTPGGHSITAQYNGFLLGDYSSTASSALVSQVVLSASASLSGTVYFDVNHNSQFDPGEPGLVGRTLYLDLNGNGQLDANEPTAITDANGAYTFTSVANGTYTLLQDLSSPAVAQTTPASGFVLTLASVDRQGLDFGDIHFSPVAPVPITPDLYGPGTNTDAESAFIRGLYHAVLARDANSTVVNELGQTVSEVQLWTNRLHAGMNRSNVALAIVNSAEHRGLQVDSFYRTFLHRAVDPAGRQFWIGRFLAGQDEAAVTQGFLTSSEFQTAHLDDDAFLSDLYFDILGRQVAVGERSFWKSSLSAGKDRAQIIDQFIHSDESAGLAVVGSYSAYLHRAADSLASYWITQLRSNALSLSGMAAAFLANPGDEFFINGKATVP